MPSAELLAPDETDVRSVGRPSALTPANAAEAARLVRAGVLVAEIAETLGIDRATFYDWQHQSPEFADSIAQARVFAAAAWADKAAEAAAEAMREPGERGERARGAAVLVGNAQWQAERRDPARWGQRSALAIDARITVAGETPLTYAEVMAARATRRERAANAREGASVDGGAQAGAVDVAASVASAVPPGA